MSTSYCASAQEISQFTTPSSSVSPSARESRVRTRPVLVADSGFQQLRKQQLTREEALRQAILRTG